MVRACLRSSSRRARAGSRKALKHRKFLMKLAAGTGESWGFSPDANGARVAAKGLRSFGIVNLGVIRMSRFRRALAAVALSLAILAPAAVAGAADLPYKVKAKPIVDVPFF